MWPQKIDWQALYFGVEIEFVGGTPEKVDLLPGWHMDLDEQHVDDSGTRSGAELQSPRMPWKNREDIRMMLDRLVVAGAKANWNCGLHVHVGLEPWGEDIVLPLIESAYSCQSALQRLLKTAEDRRIFCPLITSAMRDHFKENPVRDSLVHRGRPQSHRCGVNVAAWFDIGTVEFRLANGSLNYSEVLRTIELCLRYVAGVGAGRELPTEPVALAKALGASRQGYPAAQTAPRWYQERMWLEEMLVPILAPVIEDLYPGAEILEILPVAKGLTVEIERPDQPNLLCLFKTTKIGWSYWKTVENCSV